MQFITVANGLSCHLADKEANWLPAPTGAFNLCMRLYGPKAEALTGRKMESLCR